MEQKEIKPLEIFLRNFYQKNIKARMSVVHRSVTFYDKFFFI